MGKKSFFSEEDQWKRLVNDEKQRILTIESDPVRILMQVFELCIDNFDCNNLATKQPILYKSLLTLYESNKREPLLLEQNASSLSELLYAFNAYKEEIRFTDIQLFYALLRFIDMLKTTKAGKIYYRI